LSDSGIACKTFSRATSILSASRLKRPNDAHSAGLSNQGNQRATEYVYRLMGIMPFVPSTIGPIPAMMPQAVSRSGIL
jgi:hypothetical protein